MLCVLVVVVGCVVVRSFGGGGRSGVRFGGLGITWELRGLRGLRGLRHCLVRVCCWAVLAKENVLVSEVEVREVRRTLAENMYVWCAAQHDVLLIESKPLVDVSSVECVQGSKEFREMVLSGRLKKTRGV
jgi:hypothetical protein